MQQDSIDTKTLKNARISIMMMFSMFIERTTIENVVDASIVSRIMTNVLNVGKAPHSLVHTRMRSGDAK